MAPRDYIVELGALVIDHRLRRIVDQLLAAQAEVFANEEIRFEPRWTSTFLLLEKEEPLAVTEIAGLLRLSHPAVIKLTNAMMEAGLLADSDDKDDERRRLLRPTPRARRLAPRLHRIWDALSSAQEEVFRRAGCNVLEALRRIEEQMARRPVAEGVENRLNKGNSK